MAQCAVTPAGKLDKSQEELGDEAAVEEKFFSCIAADADHAVLIWTGLDSFGGREDQVSLLAGWLVPRSCKSTLVDELLCGRTGPSRTGASSYRTAERR